MSNWYRFTCTVAALGLALAFAVTAFADDPGFPAPTGDPAFVPAGAKLERLFAQAKRGESEAVQKKLDDDLKALIESKNEDKQRQAYYDMVLRVDALPPLPGASQGETPTPGIAKQWALVAFFDILVFFGVLMVGFAYLWKRGDIDWVRAVPAEES